MFLLLVLTPEDIGYFRKPAQLKFELSEVRIAEYLWEEWYLSRMEKYLELRNIYC